ncbi:MAG: DUF4440 domain-containing protein [Bdellovibrionales bacterium]
MKNFDEVISLENELLQANARSNPDRINELLSEGFFEFGSSGKVWTRDQVIESLPLEHNSEIKAMNFEGKELGLDLVLITYRTLREKKEALRSSIWQKNCERWQLVFHQGTLV